MAPGGWYSHSVEIPLTATDEGGSGVASIACSIDGGDPATVAGSRAIALVDVDAATHAADGPHTVSYYATDVAGNDEALHSLTVNIDTVKPATRAARPASVRRYRTATLRFSVLDTGSSAGTADVTVTIRNARNGVVKVMHLGPRPANTPLTAGFRCSMRPGKYRFSVRATDGAGNRQANVAVQTLTVLRAADD